MKNYSVKGIIKFILCLIFLLGFSMYALSSEEAAYRYTVEGRRKLEKGDYEGAINDFKTAHKYIPSNETVTSNLTTAYANYGFEFIKQDQPRRAVEQFEYALYYTAENPYVLYGLGQAYYLIQDMGNARKYLENAYKLDPGITGLRELLSKVSRETEVESAFEKNETMHFIIASSPDLSVSETSYIRTYLEEAYGRIGMLLDYYPERKVVAVLFSEDNYDKLLNKKPPWTLAIYDGKVRLPVNKFKYTNEDVIKIIFHEYAHAVIQDIAGNSCPVWLNEGIASKAEDFAKPQDKELIKRYLNEFGIADLRDMPADFSVTNNQNIQVLLYIESYLLVDYILRIGGYGGLRNILRYTGEGENVLSAITKVFNKDIDQFEKDWENYIREQYGIFDLKHLK